MERAGRRRVAFGQVTLASAAIGDTVFLTRIPVGARILGVRLNNAVGTASSTVNIGLRASFATVYQGTNIAAKTVISATALASAVSIATAANANTDSTGALISNGLTYITPYEVDVYATIAGAATPSSQLLSVTIDYVTD